MFTYYPGQRTYLTRLATKKHGLVAADTGVGKTLLGITLARLALERNGEFTGRCLIIAPGATLRTTEPDPDDVEISGDVSPNSAEVPVSQWRQELARFAPKVPVYELRNWEDYLAVVSKEDGTLPPGIYVTWYEAYFRNGSRLTIPDGWKDPHVRLCKEYNGGNVGPLVHEFYVVNTEAKTQGWYKADQCRGWAPSFAWDQHLPHRPHDSLGLTRRSFDPAVQIGPGLELHQSRTRPAEDWSEGIGTEKAGVRCLAATNLADRIEMHQFACGLNRESIDHPLGQSYPWDCLLLDEGHVCTNLDAQVTQSLIRLQPEYRYILTATPIPNIISNLFPLMGWLCVRDWYKGKQRNAAWPYAREDLGRFNETFLSHETDHTAAKQRRSRGAITKTSPVISSPARLLKLLKPSLAYMGKPEANPQYQPARIIDVRVPMGAEQARLYAWAMDRGNIPASNALVRARKQIAWLRAICADPAGFRHGGPVVSSNLNPKTLAALELIREILAAGETVTVICARIGQTDTLANLLTQAGIPFSRIDSTIPPDQHPVQAAHFKAGRTGVMLMGIKCAAGHSFQHCPNEIILSLEYSFGSLHQARGRVDRVNSRPGVRIFCILHLKSIEEAMYDRVATKEDAATICLKGQRVPRDYQPVDASEVLAENILLWEKEGAKLEAGKASAIEVRTERECAIDWPKLRDALRLAHAGLAPTVAVVRPATPEPVTPAPAPATADGNPEETTEPVTTQPMVIRILDIAREGKRPWHLVLEAAVKIGLPGEILAEITPTQADKLRMQIEA